MLTIRGVSGKQGLGVFYESKTIREHRDPARLSNDWCCTQSCIFKAQLPTATGDEADEGGVDLK